MRPGAASLASGGRCGRERPAARYKLRRARPTANGGLATAGAAGGRRSSSGAVTRALHGDGPRRSDQHAVVRRKATGGRAGPRRPHAGRRRRARARGHGGGGGDGGRGCWRLQPAAAGCRVRPREEIVLRALRLRSDRLDGGSLARGGIKRLGAVGRRRRGIRRRRCGWCRECGRRRCRRPGGRGNVRRGRRLGVRCSRRRRMWDGTGRSGLRDGWGWRHARVRGALLADRCRLGGRRRHRGTWSRRSRREDLLRVEIPLAVGGDAHAEMHVGLGVLDGTALADRGHPLALCNRLALRDRQRPEVEQRDGVAVVGPDGDRRSTAGNRPRERDDAGGGRDDRRPQRAGDVDSPVLAAAIGIRSERERPQNRSADRPRPRARCRRQRPADDERRGESARSGRSPS